MTPPEVLKRFLWGFLNPITFYEMLVLNKWLVTIALCIWKEKFTQQRLEVVKNFV